MTGALTDRHSAPSSSGVANLRVVIIDPRPERRGITKLLIERNPALTVVGAAAHLDEAEAQIRGENAEVALLEIQMPVAQGLAAIGSLHETFPDLRIVVSSFHGDAPTRDAARVLGACGYLPKPLDVDDLLALVGDTVRQPPVARPPEAATTAPFDPPRVSSPS